MKKIFLLILISSFSIAAVANNENQGVKRYALITASNNGGPLRETLRYAESDAMAMSKVLKEIGGINELENTLILSPSVEEFIQTLKKLGKKINKDELKQRLEFVFYYSGHSDEEGLLLKDGKVTYQDLKRYIDGINSDVRIALLDSCQSGAFTRTKGGNIKPPFLMNEANNVKGNIILTSASDSEAAQESDRIGGSFFTHYLISGLRGAADTSGDKTVTLNEAYNYAFQETLNNTQKTQAGAQHPAYNMQVAGAGDLVITDLQSLSSSLNIPPSITGRVFIHKANGPLVAEINKAANNEISIALESGSYRVVLLNEQSIYETYAQLSEGQAQVLDFKNFTVAKRESTTLRGDIKKQSSDNPYSLLRKNAKNDGFYLGAVIHRYEFESFDSTSAATKGGSYKGYSLNYQRVSSKNTSINFQFYETKNFGVFRGVAIDAKFSLIGADMSARNGIRLYAGLGFFRQKLFGFPKVMQPYYEEATEFSSGNVDGTYIPVGIQFLQENLMLNIGMQIRKFGFLNDNQSYYGNNYRMFLVNIGYVL